MSVTLHQILSDAKRLATKIKEHDSAADVLLSETSAVYKKMEAMKQYKEDVDELNESARQRPHSVLVSGIQQESRHLRELQQENRELRAALEEHQNALELIMSKYRQQVTQLVRSSKMDVTALVNEEYAQVRLQDVSLKVIEKQANKITEMAAVMKMAAQIDEENGAKDEFTIVKLKTENQGLRELLDISQRYGTQKLEPDCEEESEKSAEKEVVIKREDLFL